MGQRHYGLHVAAIKAGGKHFDFVCEISARSTKQGPFNDVPKLVPHVYSLDVVATGC